MANLIEEDQLSTKDLIKKFINVFNLIGNQWKLILIFAALGSLISLVFEVKNVKETQFIADIQFNLESGGNGQNAMGGFGGFASAFGMGGMGGASSNDLFTGSNLNLLISSKALYEKALMKEVTFAGKKDLFINFYKDSSDISRNEWAGDLIHDPDTKSINYRFKPKEPKDFTKDENLILGAIYDKLLLQTMMVPLDKNGSIMVLSCSTNSELLSKVWIETLLKSLEEFYVEVRTQKTRDVYKVQLERLQELESKLGSTDRQLAQTTFQNLNSVDPTAPMRQQQLNRSNTFISQQYFQQLAAVEQLKMTLIHQTPLFTVLQPVRLPLTQKYFTVGANTKIGAFIGFMICLIYIIIRKTYQELMS